MRIVSEMILRCIAVKMLLRRGHHIILQFLATISANLLNITYGLSIAWFVSNVSKLNKHETPLEVPPLSENEIKWIDSSVSVGGFIGTIFLTLMANEFGKKNTLAVMMIPQFSSWMLKMLSTNATELYIARFISGFVAGGSINVTMLFVAELADDKIRGRLNMILPVFINVGILLGFLLDICLGYDEIAYITIAFLALFLCTFTIFPDTPRQLYKINKKEEAIKSLQIYRDIRDFECQTDDCYLVEVRKIRKALKQDRGPFTFFEKELMLKFFTIALLLVVTYSCIDWFVLHQLKTGNLNLHGISVECFRIGLICIQLCSSLICFVLIDVIKRKKFLLISMFGILFAQLVYCISWLISNQLILDWLPAVCLMILVFSASIGINPMTFVIIPEMAPEKIRITAVTSVISLMWLIMFILSQFGEMLIDSLANETYFTWIPLIALNVISIILICIFF